MDLPSSSFFRTGAYLLCGISAVALVACATPSRPTLSEARLGHGRLVSDTDLRPGEVRAEIVAIQPERRQIQVRTDANRTRLLEYDPISTRVLYHGREQTVQDLQAGDVIAYRFSPRGTTDYVDTIRVQEPVQARAGVSTARRSSPEPRSELIEGTVERIDRQRGIFDVRQRNGSTVTVALPYNARPSDVDNFRRLRDGDYVRVEGEFINRDNFQLMAFAR
jgi:hypothetical protein